MPDSDPYAALVGASPQLTQAAPPSTQPDEDDPYAALVQPPVSAPASPRLPAAGAAPSSGMPAWLRVPLGAGANLLGGAENALTELGHLVGMGGGYTSQLPGAVQGTPMTPQGGLPGQRPVPSLTDINALAPQSPYEAMAQGAARGLGAGLAMPIGGLAANMLGGVLGGTAAAGAKAAGAPPAVQFGAGVLGGLACGGLAGTLERTPEQVAADLGASQDPQDAGAIVQNAARSWLADLPNKEKAVWDPVHAAVPSNTPTPLDETRDALKQMIGQGGDLRQPVSQFRKKMPENVYRSLVAIYKKQGKQTPGWEPSWSDVANFRTAVGKSLSDPQVVRDFSEENLRNLYRALTSDMGDAANNVGAGQLFEQANAQSVHLHDLAEGLFGQTVSGIKPNYREDPSAGDVGRKLLNGGKIDSQDLELMRQHAPQATNELAAAFIRHNRDNLAKAWGQLRPRAQAALVPNPADRAVLATAAPKGKAPNLAHRLTEMAIGGGLGAAASHLLPAGIQEMALPITSSIAVGAAPYIVQGAKRLTENPFAPVAGGLAATR